MTMTDRALSTMEEGHVGPMSWVLDQRGFENLIEQVKISQTVVFDFETTGLYEHATKGGPLNNGVPARIVLATFTLEMEDNEPEGFEPTTYILPLDHPESPWIGQWRRLVKTVAQTIRDYDKPLVGHHVKFDAKWVFAHTNVDLSRQVRWDTQVSSHLLDETRSTRLKTRASETYDVPEWDDFDLSYPGAAWDVPLFDLGEYAARDTYWTWRLLRTHRKAMYLDGDDTPDLPDEIVNARLGTLASWTAMPMVANLTAIEQRGMVMDVDWVRSELARHVEGRDRLLREMAERYGLDPDKASSAATSHWFKEFTARAVEAGDLQIANLTPTGQPQWSKGVLTRQANAGSEVAKMVLDQRSHAKLAEYLSAWLNYVTPRGLIHTTYNAGRVVTGRLSSQEPNMQQITKVLRPAFIPRPGYVLADIDYSQIELRVAAFISGSEPMIEAFQRGDDLHRMLALQIIQRRENGLAAREMRRPRVLTLDDVTPEDRQAGKSANFGLLYMMGPFGFREYAETVYDVSFTMEEATEVYNAFFDTWTGMREWHARAVADAQRKGYVVSPIGRVRRLPDIHGGRGEKAEAHAQRNAVNSPVQGFASDIMQMAAASIGGYLPGVEPVKGAHLVATVHDSIVAEVEEAHWEEIVAEMRERMINLSEVLHRLDCDLTVPLVAEATVGTRWGLDDVGTQG